MATDQKATASQKPQTEAHPFAESKQPAVQGKAEVKAPVVSAQATAQSKPAAEITWSQTLFGCFENPVMFVWSLCVPCGAACMQGVDAKVLFPENSNAGMIACLLNCCLCCLGAGWNRKSLREVFKYEGSYIVDCLLSMCCCCCAVSQEWREVFASKHSDANMPIWRALSDKSHSHTT